MVSYKWVMHKVNSKRKGRYLTQSFDKSPYTHRNKIQKATWQHKNATKNFDYTTIADRLRTAVSWSNYSHQGSTANQIGEVIKIITQTYKVIKTVYPKYI